MALTILAGMKLIPARLNRLNPVHAVKGSDTSRTSTTTRTADPDLVLALAANVTYEIDGLLIVSSAAANAGDFSYELQYPSGATCTIGGAGLNNVDLSTNVSRATMEANVLSPDATSPTGAMPYGTAIVLTNVIMKGRIVMGATAGNLTLAWAQLASNASSTTLKAGSWLTCRPVDGSI